MAPYLGEFKVGAFLKCDVAFHVRIYGYNGESFDLRFVCGQLFTQER